MEYCEAIYQTKRKKTRTVKVGNVSVGSDHPIRIQSMTTSSTRDVDATVDQIIKLADKGCEIARVTVQGKKEAEACEHIKNSLLKKGYTIPVVADIHFYPPAAMLVADFVDKVRINPGNFVDRRAIFKTIEYSDATYAAELEKIEEVFSPLVQKCVKLKRAIRIGTNHGSLSDRIMNRYGDTPFGMVESALEFAKVCRKYNFHDFIFSMKASNPVVMIQAYRLLVQKMMKLGWDYPLHLGLTEAGDGEDGRVKSSMGIGSLLLDGLGDTIRVSLTEDPWEEIDPCKRLIAYAAHYQEKGTTPFIERSRNIQAIKRRSTKGNSALHRDGSVVLSVHLDDLFGKEDLFDLIGGVKREKSHGTADALFIENLSQQGVEKLTPILQAGVQVLTRTPGFKDTLLVKDLEELKDEKEPCVVYVRDGDSTTWEKLLKYPVSFILLELTDSLPHQGRYFFDWIQQAKLDVAVILVGNYPHTLHDTMIHAAAECGALLADGLGEGVMLKTPLDIQQKCHLSFSILQAARMRASKTEFIACPGCGRTLFDLQEVTQRIREKTSHLPGVKIAIMGCIVNGPGEMADADFGYVGSKTGKVDLYVEKTCVEKNIDFSDADERLIQLIKAHGRWVEPLVLTPSTV